MTQLVTGNRKTFLNVAYIRQSPEGKLQQTSLLEQHERYSLHSRRPDGSHSALTGWAKTNNDLFYEKKNYSIFYYCTYFGVRTTIFYTNVPKCANAHGSSTDGTATFNPNEKASKTHFNIILPFPSKLCISDTYNFLQHVKCQPHFRSTFYYPAMRTGTAVTDVANVAVFQFRRTSVGSGVKYSDTKFS